MPSPPPWKRKGGPAQLLLARSVAEAVGLAVETACAEATEEPASGAVPAAARADAPAPGGAAPAPV